MFRTCIFAYIWRITRQIFVGTKSVAEKQNTFDGKYTFTVSVGVLHPSCYTVHAVHIHHLGNPKSHISQTIYTLHVVQFDLIKQFMLWPAYYKLWH